MTEDYDCSFLLIAEPIYSPDLLPVLYVCFDGGLVADFGVELHVREGCRTSYDMLLEDHGNLLIHL